jgi:hypothetical protein
MKLAALLACAVWTALNRIDQRAEYYPLTRLKYALLLVLTPLLALETWFLFRFLLGLAPSVITSFCGAVFNGTGIGDGAEIAGLPAFPTMIALFGGTALYLATGLAALRLARPWPRLLRVPLALAMLATALAFIFPYYYEFPTHHCPTELQGCVA